MTSRKYLVNEIMFGVPDQKLPAPPKLCTKILPQKIGKEFIRTLKKNHEGSMQIGLFTNPWMG